MGWETRGGRAYYYRKERDGSRVRSVYVGGGETARLIAQLDAMKGDEREGKRILARMERDRVEEQEADANRVCAVVETLTAAALLAAGFHTHKRQWRRIRDERSDGGC
jgi:hypothetical protein